MPAGVASTESCLKGQLVVSRVLKLPITADLRDLARALVATMKSRSLEIMGARYGALHARVAPSQTGPLADL